MKISQNKMIPDDGSGKECQLAKIILCKQNKESTLSVLPSSQNIKGRRDSPRPLYYIPQTLFVEERGMITEFEIQIATGALSKILLHHIESTTAAASATFTSVDFQFQQQLKSFPEMVLSCDLINHISQELWRRIESMRHMLNVDIP